MVHRGYVNALGIVGPAVLVSGCAAFTPMAEVQTPDGRTIKAPASVVAQMEYNWSREKQLAQIREISEQLLARPDSDGNVSGEGENGHNWKQAMVARDMVSILQDGTNPYDVEIVRTRERHQTGRAALLGLGVPVVQAGVNKLLYDDAGAVSRGGTYIKQNNRIEGSHLSNSGDLAGGPGGDGAAAAAAGEAAAAAGAPGAAGGGAEGGSRNISIGGIGNMSNSQDAYNGFQNVFDQILHGTGTIGKQPQAGFGGDNVFAPIDDKDEGSVQLF